MQRRAKKIEVYLPDKSRTNKVIIAAVSTTLGAATVAATMALLLGFLYKPKLDFYGGRWGNSGGERF